MPWSSEWAAALTRVVAATGGEARYWSAHKLRGTVKARRQNRYISGYNPPLSGAGGVGDRLSHRLGRP